MLGEVPPVRLTQVVGGHTYSTLLQLGKTGTQQTATPRVLMVMAVVDVVYEGIMFDGILWPPLL